MTNKRLKRYLNRLYNTFDLRYLSPDPLEFVHRFKDPRDQEVVGLIASALAYGQVEGILKSIRDILERIEGRPYKFTINFNPRRDVKRFNGFIHRFHNGKDIACLIYLTRQMIELKGSIGNFFLEGYRPEDRNIKQALIDFSKRVLSLAPTPIYGPAERDSRKGLDKNGVSSFFPSPEDGSPCKRLNLYLRWMVRRDNLDFGLWKDVSPSKLIIPLDTHIARISQNIGLTRRKSPDWKMAEEITENLKVLDPEDPVKYDFALSRLGILDICPKRKDRERCERCLIKEVCIL